MYLVPRGVIALMHNVPIEPDYENTMYFDNQVAQGEWFNQFIKPGCKFEAQSYSRATKGSVRVNAPIEQLYDVNYMYFENIMYSDTGMKRYYAFVTKVEYVNNVTTDVFFDIDVIQTWLFDFQLAQCYVEREHSENDSDADCLVEEDVEIGEYTGEYLQPYPNTATSFGYIVAATFDQAYEDFTGSSYNGVFSGLCLHYFPNSEYGVTYMKSFLEGAVEQNKLDGIISITVVPDVAMQTGPADILLEKRNGNRRSNGNNPWNHKLSMYPYNTLYVTNNNGTSVDFPFEYFGSNSLGNFCEFNAKCDFSCSPALILYPLQYKGQAVNYDEKMVIEGYPQIPWSNDTYKAWLAQNSLSLKSDLAIGGASFLATATKAAASVTPIGAAAATIGIGALVAHTLVKGVIASTKPRQAHAGASNSMFNLGLLKYDFINKHILPTFVDIIDDYFQMYGYACHKVKVPNISARPYWNYTKTVGCQINGSMPSDDHEKICKIFDKGIRFWKTNAVIGNYNVSNSP